MLAELADGGVKDTVAGRVRAIVLNSRH
jgi:hypothetical protein